MEGTATPCTRPQLILFAAIVALCFIGAGLFMFAPATWSRTTTILVWTGFGVALVAVGTASLVFVFRDEAGDLWHAVVVRWEKRQGTANAGAIWLM
jgi:hypothetical protein